MTEDGRALKQLGLDYMAAHSPEARGRSERTFPTHQGRLPQELAHAGITDMNSANQWLCFPAVQLARFSPTGVLCAASEVLRLAA